MTILSYPKSGRTWLRVFLGKYFELQGMGKSVFEDAYFRKQGIKFEHGGVNFGKPKAPEQLKPFKGKAIVLIRNPFDVLVSSYHHCKDRCNYFDGKFDEFVKDKHYGMPQLDRFAKLNHKRFPSVHYESFANDHKTEFIKLLNVLHIPINVFMISKAMEFASFDNMREMEQSGHYPNFLRPAEATNTDTYKTRVGYTTDGWKKYFNEDLEAYVKTYL